MKIDIIYEDQYLVVINKPSGLLVHKSPIDRNETEFALQLVRDMVGCYVYAVHRLDKPTSGVLIFAKSTEIASIMSDDFRNCKVSKSYIAIVRGYTEPCGVIDHALKQMLDTKEQKRRGITQEPKDAITKYERLSTVELDIAIGRYDTVRYSLVKLSPITGRKHQLRRHMKHISHHIIGDTKHGRGEHNKLFRERYEAHRLLLHASRISFSHPVNKKNIEINAPLDDIFARVITALGL